MADTTPRSSRSFSFSRSSTSSSRPSMELGLAGVDVDGHHDSPINQELETILLKLQEDPSSENMIALSRFYREYAENKLGVELSKPNCARLARFLMNHAGDKTESRVRPQLTDRAKDSLRLFFGFLQFVDGFQDVVEQRSAAELGAKLKFERHLTDEDGEHRLLTSELVAFLVANFPKFKDWKSYVRADAHDALEQYFGQLPSTSFEVSVPRLSSSSHLPPEGLYYDTAVDQLAEIFHTDLKSGLESMDAVNRLGTYGKNVLPQPKPPSALKIFIGQLTDFLVMILLLAAVLSAALMDFIAAAALIAVVSVNVAIGFTQEIKAERALAALASLSVPVANVVRDGETVVINSCDLVPGDVVELEEGNMVPADLRIIEAHNLRVIEALLTGEPNPIEKKTDAITKHNLAIGDRVNMAFMSTLVCKGRGRGVVVATGKDTEVGKISKALASSKNKMTPLQIKISRLGKILVLIAVVLCLAIFIIGVVRGKETIIEMVKVSISLAVSVIPEGLVAVVTITFALGVKRMLKRRAIVRKLPAVETLGSVTTICSDKTGTLTEGRMKCEEIYAGGDHYDVGGSGLEPKGDITSSSGGTVSASSLPPALAAIMTVAAVCSNSQVKSEVDSKGETEWVIQGDPTEVAMVVAAMKVGVKKQEHISELGLNFITEVPFDSDRKRMSVVYSHPQGHALVLTKGAPERVVALCTHIITGDGKKAPLTEMEVGNIESNAAKMAENGLRVLALAMREIQGGGMELTTAEEGEIEKSLSFVGLMGLIDPPRAPVQEAVRKCGEAGIEVIMITGDHPTTAKTIAMQLGILKEDRPGAVMKGSDLDQLTPEQLRDLEVFPNVFARVSPENKMDIVRALQERGEIVAMTGDGVNDAPAIKASDIGIAMGQAGTDLTIQSADIVLIDDNFATIVDAIEEGRRTYDNIIKFVMYLLSANSAEIFVMMFSVALALPIPFTAVMILWANLFADIPPALALGVDPPEPNVMSRLPRDPKAGVFTIWTGSIVVFQGLNMSLLSLIVYVVALWGEQYTVIHARTLVYSCLTTIQLFHGFLSRSVRQSSIGPEAFKNKWLIAGVIISMICLLGGIYIPFANSAILGLHPLLLWDWVKILGALLVHIGVVEFVKLLLRLIAKYDTATDAKFYSELRI